MAGPAEPAAVVHVLGCAVDWWREYRVGGAAVAGGYCAVVFYCSAVAGGWGKLIVGEGVKASLAVLCEQDTQKFTGLCCDTVFSYQI